MSKRIFRLDNLHVLVDSKGKTYPRIFTSKEDAEHTADVIGDHTIHSNLFIDDK